MNEQSIESLIEEKGLTAPRLTPEYIDDCIISDEYHVFKDSCMTVCCLILRNGFSVAGYSSCVSPENFDAGLGVELSYRDARDKIWQLEGYLLKTQLMNRDAQKN